jgi:signal transduction histidine kinase
LTRREGVPPYRVTSDRILRLEERLSEMETQNRRLATQLAAVEDERQRADRRRRLLAKLDALAGSPEHVQILPEIAERSIPELADWAVLDLVEGDGPRRLKVAHRDPAGAPLAEQLTRVAPGWRQGVVWPQLATGQSVLIGGERGTPEQHGCWSPPELEIHARLGTRSALLVPVLVDATVVGVASFYSTEESKRRYGAEDLALGEELVRRVARLVESARLQRQLAEHESNFAIALARSNICVFQQDRNLRFKWINNRVVGDGEVQPGLAETSYIPTESMQAMQADKQRVLQTGERTRSELPVVLGGEERQLVVAHEPARSASGEIVGLIGTMVDVTEERRSRKELAEALAFRERVMGILGHDLRNPLSAITALATATMRRPDLPPAVGERLEQIDRAAKRSLSMIETLLDFSESRFKGALSTRPVAAPLADVAARVVEELRAAHPERLILLDIRSRALFPIDPVRMEQALSNLVANALIHGDPRTSVAVMVDVAEAEALLAVKNRGPVIPEARISSLFEPFTQGTAADSDRPRGLGLGLYIVRHIVAGHGGTISVESSEEGGTTFIVRLPRLR